ncbi:sialidase family protein [Asticcacaulis excentricus]|nr:sialidase family protein [Asticcacaulis excentricus]
MKAQIAALFTALAPVSVVPYEVKPDLFNASEANLGLRKAEGTQTVTVFRPQRPEDGGFNNGAVPVVFKGRLFVQWQSSQRDEDSADTHVLYSVSDDGVHWQPPQLLAGSGEGGEMRSSGGWWTDGNVLIAYINVWPEGFQSGKGGYTTYQRSTDGVTWDAPQRLMNLKGEPVEGIIEQDPHSLPDGRILTAFHLRPGLLVSPYYTDDPLGISGWVRGRMRNLPSDDANVSRELEPSLFLRGNCAVMVFRDQMSSFRQLASESCNRGQDWTPPVVTTMPDSRSKQSAGNLPNGTAFVINNPSGDKLRLPLAITLSPDGRTFDRSFLLRGADELTPLQFEGRYKRIGYHYPKSVVWNEYLYVVYSTHKETIDVTRVPLDSLK